MHGLREHVDRGDFLHGVAKSGEDLRIAGEGFLVELWYEFSFFTNWCSYSVISVLSAAFKLFLSAYICKSVSWHTSSKEKSLLCTV